MMLTNVDVERNATVTTLLSLTSAATDHGLLLPVTSVLDTHKTTVDLVSHQQATHPDRQVLPPDPPPQAD